VAEWHLGPGTVIDRFEVYEYLRPCPAGGEYEGYDRTLHHFVTIAVLRALSSADDRRRFVSAAPRMAAVRHASIAPVAGFGQSEEIPYVVYDCESRSSLDDAVRGRGMPDEPALRLLAKVADAVDTAHQRGFVHGDLSPLTIVLDPRGEPLVVGLGLAPLMTRRREGAAFTPDPASTAYIAPEEAQRGEITPASDRYSFAATAYEVLTGSVPPAAPAAKENLGPATARVFRTGLAPAGEARWPSCAAMVDALAAARREDMAAAHNGPSAGTRWLIAGIAILAIAIGVLVWATSRPVAPAPAVSLSDSNIAQGESLLVSGSGLPANQVGTVGLESTPQQIGAFQADQNGNTNVRVTIPAGATPGGHVISLCWNGGCHASAKVTVTESAASPTPSASPSASPSPSPSPSPKPSASPTPSRSPVSAASPS